MSLDPILASLGIVVGIVGFALAIYQIALAKREIRKSISVAEATQRAVGERERLGTIIELMGTIPQLQRLERDLNVAVQGGNKDAVLNQLHDWRKLVTETRGLIAEQSLDTDNLEGRLQESSNAAAQTIGELGDGDLRSETKWIITKVAAVSEEAGVLMGKLRAHPGGDETGAE